MKKLKLGKLLVGVACLGTLASCGVIEEKQNLDIKFAELGDYGSEFYVSKDSEEKVYSFKIIVKNKDSQATKIKASDFHLTIKAESENEKDETLDALYFIDTFEMGERYDDKDIITSTSTTEVVKGQSAVGESGYSEYDNYFRIAFSKLWRYSYFTLTYKNTKITY